MPWGVRSEMDEKKEFIILSKCGRFTVTELCEMFGISRTTAYKYLDRYARQGFMGLEELSRAPMKHPNRTPDEIIEKVIELRKAHPRWGAVPIQGLLKNKYNYAKPPSFVTINKILKDNGLIKPRKRHRRVAVKGATNTVYPVMYIVMCFNPRSREGSDRGD